MTDVARPASEESSTQLIPADRPRGRSLPALLLLVFVTFAAVAAAWFQPHKLFVDDTVDEAVPLEQVELVRAQFRSLEHHTTGAALVYRAIDGELVLHLADLDTSNGPDLRVILSSAALSDDPRGWGDDSVEVDRLKGNVGSQNYVLPDGVDLSRYGRVVIWCDRFDVGFAVADIAAANT
jgi:Electron transfer DM13